MIDSDTRYDVIVNIGAAMPLPNRPFRYLAQTINGAPPNLKLVVCASSNPLTQALIRLTLLREESLGGRFCLVDTYAQAQDLVRQSRGADG